MKNRRIVYVPTMEEMEDKAIYIKLWMIFVNIIMKDTSRREWLDKLSVALIKPDVVILYRSGKLFTYGDLDEIFGDDQDVRWMSHFLEPDSYKNRPKRYSKKIARLAMLMIFIKVEKPNLAHHLEHKR